MSRPVGEARGIASIGLSPEPPPIWLVKVPLETHRHKGRLGSGKQILLLELANCIGRVPIASLLIIVALNIDFRPAGQLISDFHAVRRRIELSEPNV